MRSIRWLAAVTGTLALASGCGGGSNVGPNLPPAASFAEVCTALSCVFTDASTDPDAGNTIASWSWNFGEPTSATNTSNVQSPTHLYAAAGTYAVTLTVTDNAGAASPVFSKNVTVTAAPPVNTPPAASFDDPTCSATACSFHSTSTDADGQITTYAWNFGEPSSPTNTANTADASHTYNNVTVADFTVSLTVTDDDGATATATKTITISPAAACQDAAGQNIACTLNITRKSTVTITLADRSCELAGNQLYVVAPIQQTIFLNGCSQPKGKVYPVTGTFTAGQGMQIKFTQGAGKEGDPAKQAPAIRLTGSWPDWTLNIDDGGNAAQPRDFDDLIVTVHATEVS